MKILMLSWEYPPKNVGGLSNHVYFLSKALNEIGHEVHVITCEEEDSAKEELMEGVFVHRVEPYEVCTEDFTKWVMHLNFAMNEEAVRLINKFGKFDIIHAHDWLSVYAAKALKWAYRIPMVATIHATEYGRNGGIKTDMQKYISSAEWMLSYEAWKLVVCSDYMKKEVNNLFKAPLDKVKVIPNGVAADDFDFKFDWLEFRRKFALDDEKIVIYVGRHVYEKGIQHLIEAVPSILNSYNRTKFVIVGKGSMTEELEARVKELGVEQKVLFAGYMDEDSKKRLYRVSNAAVFPSLYEPFGIVALEAMAAGCPVVASDVGGLSELVEHKVNGLKSTAGSVESLKDNVLELLFNAGLSNYIKENGLKSVAKNYTWGKIAENTTIMYEEVRTESKGTMWQVDEIIEKNCENKLEVSLDEGELSVKEAVLKEKLNQLEEAIALKQQEVQEKEKEIVDKLEVISEKESELKQKEKELKQKEKEIKKREKEAKLLEKNLKEEMKASLTKLSEVETTLITEGEVKEKPKRTRKTTTTRKASTTRKKLEESVSSKSESLINIEGNSTELQ